MLDQIIFENEKPQDEKHCQLVAVLAADGYRVRKIGRFLYIERAKTVEKEKATGS